MYNTFSGSFENGNTLPLSTVTHEVQGVTTLIPPPSTRHNYITTPNLFI